MDPLSPHAELRLQPAARPRPFIRLATTIELALVPALCTALALVVYDGIAPLVALPPPLTVWAAGAVVGLLQYRRAGELLSAVLFGSAAVTLAWTFTVGAALVIGLGRAIDCLGPNGGCLPW